MFNFGKNWQDFSLRVLDQERVQTAKASLQALLDCEDFSGRRFLDVGCGTGLFTIAAVLMEAQSAVGIDVNPLCVDVSRQNAVQFLSNGSKPFFQIGNALDAEQLAALGEFDIVYAWGSLHHTGDMYRAIRLVAERVAPNGTFVLAIYNKHKTSPLWKGIKWLYNRVPGILQRLMLLIFAAVIYVAKFAVTRQNPLKSQRGMDFWVDVVDWVGGYPYEYASPQEIEAFVMHIGFIHQKTVPPVTPTGCNEFVFIKDANSTH